jgi:opacity protein-like surface antigen/outer membrane protease
VNGFLSGVRKSCPVATPHGNFDQVSISRFPSPKAFATLISGGSGSELGAALKGVLLGRVTLVSLIACWAMSDGAEAAKKHAKSQVSKSQVSHQIAEAPLSPAVHNWSGFYIGLNAGMAWGQFDPVTSTVRGGSITNPGVIPLLNAAGPQTAGPFGFAGGAQAGYTWQSGSWVAGIESDVSYLHLNFSARSYVPFAPFNTNTGVINAYDNANWVATLRPRLGFASGNWLYYVTGGLAVTQFDDDFALTTVLINGDYLFAQSGALKGLHAGYAAGGGVEYAIDSHWSARAEYQHLGFGRLTAKQVSTLDPTQPVTQSADLNADIVRLGLDYRFGGSDPASAAGSSFAPHDSASIWNKNNWEFNFGMRAFFSNGLDAESNPLYGVPPIVLSRLFWSNLNSLAGETYGRVDHASGWFVKGNLGAGGVFNGTLNDEDFPAFSARSGYSNTASKVTGSLGYATVDVGYTFLKSPGAKLGAFVGYNFYSQQTIGHGCIQIADGDSCFGVNPGYLIISNDDQYNSMRVGLSAEFMLTDRLKFSADAAYVPLVNMSGVDNHNARGAYFPETGSDGYGTMMEALFSYNITDHWDVGAGGRYWAWTMRHGTSESVFETLGSSPPSPEPNNYGTRRYGAFVQSGYHWGDTTRSNADVQAFARGPMNWSGLYVGGHLGGAWSTAAWADPFGATLSPDGSVNFAGFGDVTKAHGPLGGVQAGANWQFGPWVYGLEGEASYTGLRGDNTCFSGIGGINCEHVVNALATLAGRAGFAWDRSLFYLKAGGAWTNTTYNLDGNTFGLSLGLASTHIDTLGWVAGIGLEYAITDHWTTRFEYDHIDLANVTPSFPTLPIVNTQRLRISQSVDTLELGVNYKLDWPALASN